MRTVLVIDDNPAVCHALNLLFGLYDIETLVASTPALGLQLLAERPVDVVILDMNFSTDTTSGEEGTELFLKIRRDDPDLPVILLTAWTHLESAVELVKAGAADYIAKPWNNDKLLSTVENLLELAEANRHRQRVWSEQNQRRVDLAAKFDLRGVVFASDAMQRTLEVACRVARSDARVLITGPNGAGKERVAQIVHANSAVSGGPFVAVNCGALPPDLIEAEMFGVETGAYTGAGKARQGRFEAASRGTLFLDEIANLPLAGQVKLLRVLETGTFEMLGSTRTLSTTARIVTATNADLPSLIRKGLFREDLYYRLNVVEIEVPPLSARREDIVPLARHFLGPSLDLSDAAADLLEGHDWPGNVRELYNTMARAKLFARTERIEKEDLSLSGRQAPNPKRNRGACGPSREAIENSLKAARGNVSRAAQSLGLSRQALYRRMQRFDLRIHEDE